MTEEELVQAQPRSMSDLKPKMRLQGVVKETQLYGAVVDVGLEYYGMVHISQLSPERVNRVTDVVQPGDNVTVWITEVNPAKGRIGLTMIEPPGVDWRELAEGQIHTGAVTRIEPYGVFVDIGAERPGLLHVREMSAGYLGHPSEMVKMGEEIDVRILKLERRKRRIDLTMMGLDTGVEEDDPEEEPAKTAMEVALERAQAHQPQQHGQERRRDKHQPSDLSEQEDILARTLKQHSQH